MIGGAIVRWISSALIVLCLAFPARATQVVYDAGNGALPQATGWNYADLAPGVPAPVDSAGLLFPHATGALDTRFWHRNDVPFTFNRDFSLDITMNVISSDYIPNVGDGTQRSGFYFEAVDTLGRRLTLGIASAGVTVNTDRTLQPTNGIPLVNFVTQGAFHDYEVEAVSDSLILRIDGVRHGACPLGAPLYPNDPDDVYFGDGSNATGSNVAIEFARYGNTQDPTSVNRKPVPAGARLRISPMGIVGRGGVDFALRSADDGRVHVGVFDLGGRRLADLGTVILRTGRGRVHWTGRDDAGFGAPPGLYVVSAAGTAGRGSCKAVVLP